MALKDLIINEAEVTEEVLEEAIKNLIKFSEQGKILMNREFRQLPTQNRILVYLAAKKAWSLISQKNEDAFADNAELQKTLNVPGGTLRPRIKEFRDNGLVISRGGKHTISDAGPEYIKLNIKSRGSHG